MQTILGAGGDIGRLLAKELRAYTSQVRLVGRNPQKINTGDTLFAANLLDRKAVAEAVSGSQVVYLTAGLPYVLRTWQQQWPVIMNNVINACLEQNSKLVFFDNVYLYDRKAIPHLKEDSPVAPPSQKGQVRAGLIRLINNAQDKGLQALIARSADFYGPGAKNGILNVLVTENFKKGKSANWQSDLNKIHSLTYTPDAARATALLGNTEDAFNQVWHLPTSAERLTGKQFIELAAKIAGKKATTMVLTPFLLSLLGTFSKLIRELKEMQYQYNQDFFLIAKNSTQDFNFHPPAMNKG